MIKLNVSKTVSIDVEDLVKINILVNEGKIPSFSEFIQQATKNHLEKFGLEGE